MSHTQVWAAQDQQLIYIKTEYKQVQTLSNNLMEIEMENADNQVRSQRYYMQMTTDQVCSH